MSKIKKLIFPISLIAAVAQLYWCAYLNSLPPVYTDQWWFMPTITLSALSCAVTAFTAVFSLQYHFKL